MRALVSVRRTQRNAAREICVRVFMVASVALITMILPTVMESLIKMAVHITPEFHARQTHAFICAGFSMESGQCGMHILNKNATRAPEDRKRVRLTCV